MSKQTLAYLACPHTHEDKLVQKKRLLAANWTAYKLISQGIFVYSPLTHNMPLDELGEGTGWLKWRPFDSLMVSRCDKIILLKMPGWEKSKGVAAEINQAKELKMPIEEIDPPDEEILEKLLERDSVQGLIYRLKKFYEERDWDQFHSPKNLAMNIAVEVGELLETFRWKTLEQSSQLSDNDLQNVSDEIGDVFNMLVYLADKLDIDPLEVSHEKIVKMGQKYPSHLCKGKALKYTEYAKQSEVL